MCDQQLVQGSCNRQDGRIEGTGFPACFTIISNATAKVLEAERCAHMRTYCKRAALC